MREFKILDDLAIDDLAIQLFAPIPTDKGKIIDGKIIGEKRFCNRRPKSE